MAIIGKLMGARPSMSAPRAAPRPTPVVSRPSLDFLTGGQPKQTIPAPSLDRDALIQDILSKIEVPTAPIFDPSALEKQIADLRQRPSRDDFMSIERQVQDLRNREIPQFDPSALQSRIAELEGREVPTIDREELVKDITGRIKQPRPFDPTRIRERLAALENRRPAPVRPLFDPSRLQARLDALESREPVVLFFRNYKVHKRSHLQLQLSLQYKNYLFLVRVT